MEEEVRLNFGPGCHENLSHKWARQEEKHLLDHVVARVRGGRNGYRNLVSACAECNSQKGERRAEDFLRWLWRERRLSGGELKGRFLALARLAAGKLRPPFENRK